MKLYYYTSVPLLTCNILYYSLTTISASIVSSQNVCKFMYEHPLSDTIVFKREIESMDLHNTLKIVESLIYDVVRIHCSSDEEYENLKQDIADNKNGTNITVDMLSKNEDILLVDVKYSVKAFDKMRPPIRISLLALLDTVTNIHSSIEKIKTKIDMYNKTYFRSLTTINLQDELEELKRHDKLLNSRLNMFNELLKIYGTCLQLTS